MHAGKVARLAKQSRHCVALQSRGATCGLVVGDAVHSMPGSAHVREGVVMGILMHDMYADGALRCQTLCMSPHRHSILRGPTSVRLIREQWSWPEPPMTVPGPSMAVCCGWRCVIRVKAHVMCQNAISASQETHREVLYTIEGCRVKMQSNWLRL